MEMQVIMHLFPILLWEEIDWNKAAAPVAKKLQTNAYLKDTSHNKNLIKIFTSFSRTASISFSGCFPLYL